MPSSKAQQLLASVKDVATKLPSRVLFHAAEKFGKTSWAAHAPNVVFGLPYDETGLLSLIDAGQIDKTPYLPLWKSYSDVVDAVNALIEGEHEYRTFVIDTINSVERLIHEHIVRQEYQGEWGERGFTAYQRGYKVAVRDWRNLIHLLDRLRVERGVSVIMLAHTDIQTFDDPNGAKYDFYAPAIHKLAADLLNRWSDVTLFGEVHVEEVDRDVSTKKSRVASTGKRLAWTRRDPSFIAGNRYGLPACLDFGTNSRDAWKTFANAMQRAKKGGKD